MPYQPTVQLESRLLHPRHWPSWVAVGLLRLISALPFAAKIIAGTILGEVAYYLARHRRNVVETNVSLCFPELTGAKKRKLVKSTLRQNGIGFFEIAWAWWVKPESLDEKFDIDGFEHLHAAQEGGSGVLLIGAHFTHLDLAGLMINRVADIDAIYRRNNNPVFEYVITKGRQKAFRNVLERSDMRKVVKKLREGRVVWYSPDQDHGRRHSVFAPFFGVAATTVTAGTRLLKLGKARPVFLYHYRDTETNRYRIVFRPAPESLPTGDDAMDARLINQMIEQGIRQQPDQYMWVHRRFKTRPDGELYLY